MVEKKQLLNSQSQSKEEPEGEQVGNLEGERREAKSSNSMASIFVQTQEQEVLGSLKGEENRGIFSTRKGDEETKRDSPHGSCGDNVD